MFVIEPDMRGEETICSRCASSGMDGAAGEAVVHRFILVLGLNLAKNKQKRGCQGPKSWLPLRARALMVDPATHTMRHSGFNLKPPQIQNVWYCTGAGVRRDLPITQQPSLNLTKSTQSLLKRNPQGQPLPLDLLHKSEAG